MKGAVRIALPLMVLAAAGLPLWAGGASEPEERVEIAVVTPYMASATTAQVINQFQEYGEENGWNIRISDTAGDFGLLVTRIQDMVSQQVDAIVLGMGDPQQMSAGLSAAEEAGVPVFGLDAGFTDGVYLNVTSDNHDLGRQAAEALIDVIGEEGPVVMFTHDPHPGVRARAEGARELFAEYPGIEIVREIHIEVPGPVDFARSVTEDLLTSFSAAGSIAGIWAGWDEPAYGATQAIQRDGRDEIRVVGVDGTDFAKQEIDSAPIFTATIEQDFDGMARLLSNLVRDYLAGETVESREYQIPGTVYR